MKFRQDPSENYHPFKWTYTESFAEMPANCKNAFSEEIAVGIDPLRGVLLDILYKSVRANYKEAHSDIFHAIKQALNLVGDIIYALVNLGSRRLARFPLLHSGLLKYNQEFFSST